MQRALPGVIVRVNDNEWLLIVRQAGEYWPLASVCELLIIA